MKIFGRTTGFASTRAGKRILVALLPLSLLFASWPQSLLAKQDAQAQSQPSQEAQAPYAQQSPEQIQQLVAPIALYPDSLVAQILAAATFPEQIVEADRWVQAHSDLKGDELARAVDQQPWDASVKALAPFPAVLGNMDKNLSWTSSLGDAYYNQQQDVMDAVQVMRQRAQGAGNLRTTPQQTVRTEGSDIDIEPTNPEVVYVPAYNPWSVYGGPIGPWPGWYPYPGIWYGGPYLSFGLGFGLGFYGGYGWGWNHWGFDWHNRYSTFNRGRYYSGSRTFYNRSSYYRGGGARGGVNGGRGGVNNARGGAGARVNAGNRPPNAGAGRGGASNRGGATAFNGNRQAARGYGQARGQTGTRSGAFSGYNRGGQTRTYSSRGSASSGGGAARGGGGSRGGGGGAAHSGGGGKHP
jgi:hypothetical protein